MNTPLLTAETSLYKTSQSYHGPRSRPAAGSTIVAQQSECVSDCLDAARICRRVCRSSCCVSVPFVGDVCIPGCRSVCEVPCNIGLGTCVRVICGESLSGGGGGGGGGGGDGPVMMN